MVLYKCEKCGYETMHKSNYIKHINRKNPCRPPDLMCTFCNKTYANKGNLARHIKTYHSCQEDACNKEKELLSKINSLEKEIKDIKNIPTSNQTIHNTTNNTTNNINQMNVIINSFGDENISYITEDFLTKLICTGVFNSIPKLVRQIHFNPNRPENNNVKITNKKLSYASVYKNNRWEYRDKKEVIENLVNRGYGLIDEHFDAIQNELPAKYKQRYKDYDRCFNDENGKEKKKQMKNTELVIINAL